MDREDTWSLTRKGKAQIVCCGPCMSLDHGFSSPQPSRPRGFLLNKVRRIYSWMRPGRGRVSRLPKPYAYSKQPLPAHPSLANSSVELVGIYTYFSSGLECALVDIKESKKGTERVNMTRSS